VWVHMCSIEVHCIFKESAGHCSQRGSPLDSNLGSNSDNQWVIICLNSIVKIEYTQDFVLKLNA
jgi:hypothetical protein